MVISTLNFKSFPCGKRTLFKQLLMNPGIYKSSLHDSFSAPEYLYATKLVIEVFKVKNREKITGREAVKTRVAALFFL